MNLKDFQAGYVRAAEALIELHDQPGMAADVLYQLGPINWRQIDPYDRETFKSAGLKLKNFTRKLSSGDAGKP